MKLLFLTPYLPSPPHSGGPRRLHGLMSGLARSHDVAVLALVDPTEDQAAAVRATREYCGTVLTAPNDRYGLTVRRKRALQMASLASPWSFERLVHHRPAFQAALDELVARVRFDAITVEFAQLASYRLPRGPRLVLDEHNIEYDVLRRTAAADRRLDRKVYNAIDYRKLRREERAAWRRFAGCLTTSARDEAIVRRSRPGLPTAVIPNAVDTSAFRPADAPPEPGVILFFGAINYYPNTDALLYFLDEALPLIRRRQPGARVWIVGQSPPEAITSRASAEVIVTGLVDDVRPYLARAAVVVAPLRIGGGTRLKIVEALAMGKAIVSTTLGAEGLDVVGERELLLADTAPDFARQVCRVLDDGALARRLGAAARRAAEARYSWDAAVARLERFYAELPAPAAPVLRGSGGKPGTAW
jgi:glycosyltransferase involved in cell wall biosynthesis